MHYRPQIDGLRAVAVVGVLLFHLGIAWLPGGALGVDVFFVISGFLITHLLLREMEQERFSFAGFYDRRARRILPALVPPLLFSCLAAYLVLDVYNYHLFCNSLSSLAVFGSNFYFWTSTQGYFAAAAQEMPLLHTWSLSVEEQFYLLYPLVLLALRGRLLALYFKPLLVLLFTASLATYCLVGYLHPAAAFYNSALRFWQLLAGALLAAGLAPVVKREKTLQMISLLSIVLVLASFLLFRANTPFSFLFSWMATAGAAGLVYTSDNTVGVLSRVLGSRVFVFVGKISYSLYLWHWPLIVFASILSLQPPGTMTRLVLAATSFLLACLSYRYVEKPFRNREGWIQSRRMVLGSSLLLLVLIAVCGKWMYGLDLSDRSRADRLQLEAKADSIWNRMGAYTERYQKSNDTLVPFSIGDTSQPAERVVWGDSHAQALATGIARNEVTGKKHSYVFSYPGVAPLLGVDVRTGGPAFTKRVFDFIAAHPRIHTVVLVARWRAYFTRTADTCKITDPSLLDDTAQFKEPPGKAIFKSSLLATIAGLRALGKKVVLVSCLPEAPLNFSRIITHVHFYRNSFNDYGASRNDFDITNGELNRFLESLRADGVEVIASHRAFLSGNRYLLEKNGHLLYRDYNHLSRFGAMEVAKLLESSFE